MNEKFFSLPKEKQQAILDAGYRVFSQNSYKKSPMSEIADAAGISKSLLFHYFHNKKDIPSNLDEYEALFVKMIRDADKIDIIRVMSNFYQEFSVPPKNELMDKYLSGDTIDLKLINNKSEKALLHLSFMKDLSFVESFEVLKETGNIESYLNNINVKEEYKELFDFLVSQIKEKEKEYVKYKI